MRLLESDPTGPAWIGSTDSGRVTPADDKAIQLIDPTGVADIWVGVEIYPRSPEMAVSSGPERAANVEVSLIVRHSGRRNAAPWAKFSAWASE